MSVLADGETVVYEAYGFVSRPATKRPDLDAIEALVAKLSPGPWLIDERNTPETNAHCEPGKKHAPRCSSGMGKAPTT